MEENMEELWRDVSEDGQDKSNIRALRWDICTREKGWFIKRGFLVSVPHPKEGNIVWTCLEDNIIEENVGLNINHLKKSKVREIDRDYNSIIFCSI